MTADTTPPAFAPRGDTKTIEEGSTFAPRFDADGLIPCITTHAETGEVLMFAYMNDLALAKTIETGYVHYWSRSRGKLWKKGESSGMSQKVTQMLTDCDQDCIVVKVEIGAASMDASTAASCHVGYRNCFYRAVPIGQLPEAPIQLQTVQEKVFDPDVVYGQ